MLGAPTSNRKRRAHRIQDIIKHKLQSQVKYIRRQIRKIARTAKSEQVRLNAWVELLDRLEGKPAVAEKRRAQREVDPRLQAAIEELMPQAKRTMDVESA